MGLTPADYVVSFLFVGGVVAMGCSFFKKSSRSADAFTRAGGKLPMWVVGMSIFATFVSSISFLGLPGGSYEGNWNQLVFSITIPVAVWLAARFFVPMYRRMESVSAYHYLSQRFGWWAGAYVGVCYLLTQVARIGSILLLLAIPMQTLFGWDTATVIVVTGVLTVGYSLLGGISAVMWADALQGIILIVGAVVCAILLTCGMPEGPGQIFRIASAEGKLSLGGFSASLQEPTFWVVLVYGLMVNLQNFGIDQNYVQRYKTARSTREAVGSTLLGGLLYVPVSFVFVYIGTALYAYYTARPGLLPSGVTGDAVFPYYIASGLPAGVSGLVFAALFAAGMSTISTSINSSATILLTDFHGHFRPEAVERTRMRVLYLGSLAVGVAGIATGLLMMHVDGVLEAWWKLASVFSGGMLGLLLLALCCKDVPRTAAVAAAVAGLGVIVWLTLRHPVHTYLTIVFGTAALLVTGLLLTWIISHFKSYTR